MPVRKLDTVDAFVLTDFADVPASGFVRRARKILQSSTWDMARSATYAFAAFGIERSGASAGVNATDDEADDAVARFRLELQNESDTGQLRLLPGRGVSESTTGNSSFLVATVLAAAESALGSELEGRTVAVESSGTPPEGLSDALSERGAVLTQVEGVEDKPWLVWGADVDLLLVGSKPGAMNHQGAEMVNAKAVVPWGPIPITTKALAVLINRGVTYVPDFISASGSLLEGLDSVSDASGAAEQVSNLLVEVAAGSSNQADEPLFLASCRKAEAFIETWQDSLPFGRPLAG